MHTSCILTSPLGLLKLTADAKALTEITFYSGPADLPSAEQTQHAILCLAAVQLSEYFTGTRRYFEIPLAPVGTDFQQRVWQALLTIPYGTTASYQDIAVQIGQPLACRAVGGANNKNPLPIVIPCHRVIGKSGTLIGYAGGLAVKKFLLNLESPKPQ